VRRLRVPFRARRRLFSIGTQVDRRRLLTSLAVGAASAGLPYSVASATGVAETLPARNTGPTCGAWLIARQPHSELAPHHVIDFWSMPWSEIGYANNLPPQIARGVIWYETIDAQEALDCIDRIYRESYWADGLPRQCAAHFDGAETLSSTLASLIGNSKSERRIALVALDSIGPEKDWAHILPVLSRCYDAVIGICHVERRGLRHQKACLAREFFERHFLNPARLCDP